MDRLRSIQISATPSARDIEAVYDAAGEKLKRLCTDKRRQRRDTHVAPTALMLRLTQRRLYDMHADATSREERHHDDPRCDETRETVIDCSGDDDDDEDYVSGVDTERAFDDLVDAIVFSTHTLADDFNGRFEEDVYVHAGNNDVTANARRNDAMDQSRSQKICATDATASRDATERRDVTATCGRKRLADTELVHDDAKRAKQTPSRAEHVTNCVYGDVTPLVASSYVANTSHASVNDAHCATDVTDAASDVATPRCTDVGDVDGYDLDQVTVDSLFDSIFATYYSSDDAAGNPDDVSGGW